METNGTESIAQLMGEEDGFAVERIHGNGNSEIADHSAVGSLVNRIASGIAKELALAIRELEHHIFTEARNTGETVERRLDSFHADLGELSRFMGEQRSANGATEDRLRQFAAAESEFRDALARHAGELETIRAEARDFAGSVAARFEAAMAALDESNARHARERDEFQNETRASLQPVSERIDNLCRQLDARQEDIETTKTTLNSICARIDGIVERLDRQAGAVRSLHGAYQQSGAEIEQIVDGLVRLKALPRPVIEEGL